MDIIVPEEKARLDAALLDASEIGGRALSEASRAAYKSDVDAFNTWLDANARKVTVESIREYFGVLLETSAGSTVNRKRAAIIAVMRRQFQHAPELKLAAEKAIKDAVRPVRVKHTVDATEMLSAADVEALAVAADVRTACIIRFLFATGCRVSEMCAARVKDVKVNGMVSILVRGKGNKERTVKISVALYEAIRGTFAGNTYLFETRTGNPYNRSNVWTALQRVSERLHPHILRHSFATLLISKGVPLSAVSEALGHAEVSVTATHYSHVTPDWQKISAVTSAADSAPVLS